MTKAVFQLEPLTCPSCIKKIEMALMKTQGVESAKVLFHTSKVRAEFDANLVSAQKLEEAIRKLGYPVLSSRVS